ncbi:BON domain-containing protein [Lichenicoccus roseus]|uniref:BON domain-containing protein n=1 Tax=Lichenicoccus roseus TaxID=2683649 RepID=A0A5R9JFT7_9PROT|nr:BON domain-containing protein [Lichenicoccus roseus]TLU74531.1 BON domain-containing protein [Lichenicoccus roseus]
MIDDIRLREDVLAELLWEPSVACDGITVTARRAVVTLSGHVGSYAQKSAAAAATRRVAGVQAVVERIKVRLPAEMGWSDGMIAATAAARLASNVFVPAGRVLIAVKAARVTLTGQLDWWFQREAVEQDMRALSCIVDLSNRITIQRLCSLAAPPAADRGDEMVEALYRAWFLPTGASSDRPRA